MSDGKNLRIQLLALHSEGMFYSRLLLPCAVLLTSGLIVAQGNEASRPVTVTEAVRDHAVQIVELTGSVTAKRQSRLSSRTSGLIRKLHVDAGDQVKQGDLLMELDPDLAALAKDRVKAELDQAKAELAEAERQVEEVKELAKLGGFSKSEAETREATARVRAAAVKQKEVQLREQTEMVMRHQLIAPFTGVISRKLAEEGEWVQTGVPVLELVETDRLQLDVQAPQEMYGRLKEAAEIKVVLDTRPPTELSAKITARVPVKDPVSRTFLLRLEMEDSKGIGAVGMSGRAVFQLRSDEMTLLVPRDSVVRSPDGSVKVWIVEQDGDTAIARSQTVKLGDSLNRMVSILEGLKEKAMVVLRGNESLREGQPVTVVKE